MMVTLRRRSHLTQLSRPSAPIPMLCGKKRTGRGMKEPSEEAVLKRARELWEEAGYTDRPEFKPMSNPRGPLPPARTLLSPTRREEFIQQARNELRQTGNGA